MASQLLAAAFGWAMLIVSMPTRPLVSFQMDI
jgi:hypothetical protein